MSSRISSILLVGGKSSRLGTDKARIKLDGRSAIAQQVAEKLLTLSDEVIVVTDGRRYDHLKVRWVSDVYLGAGPLGGLHSGLLAARSSHALVVACDMPFLNLALLRYMISLPRDYDVLIPKLGHELEPLHAIYSRKCLQPIERLLKVGRFKILDFFDQVIVRYLTEEEIERYDPDHRSFFNINTPDELIEAMTIIKKGESSSDQGGTRCDLLKNS